MGQRAAVAGMMAAVLFAATVTTVARGAAAETKRPAITGLAYVRFYEDDMPAAKHFYGQLLGLQETGETDGVTSFAVGVRQRIEVAPKPADAPSYLARVGFLTKDLPAMRQFLEAHGQQVEAAGADEIRLKDPEGNAIALCGRAARRRRRRGPVARVEGPRWWRRASGGRRPRGG